MKYSMVKSLSFFLLLHILQFSVAQTEIKIEGTIEDFANGKVILFEALTRDTLAKGAIVDHQFTLFPSKGEVSGQALPAMLLCLKGDGTQSSAAPLAIENHDLIITISGTKGNSYTGTPLQEGYSRLIQDLMHAEMTLNETSSENTRDSIRSVIAGQIESYYLKTRNTNFNTFMALVMLDFLNRKFIDPKDLVTIGNQCLDNKPIDSLDQMVCDFLRVTDTGWKGKHPPELKGKTLDGKLVNLSDVIGTKPVIIDFWASWCGPCLKEMPELKNLYAEGKVEIIGVSIDDQHMPWEKALDRLQLPWTNILDEDKLIAKRYKVIAVPAKFVISKEGVIIAHNPDDLSATLQALY